MRSDDTSDSHTTALVLGGRTGMLGQALVTACQAQGWKTRVLGREDGPVADPAFLDKFLSEVNPAYIFNTIAYTAVDAAEDHQAEADTLNRALPSALGRLVRGSSAYLIHYSTDFVFNGKKDSPYLENDATCPLNVYGSTKLAGEQALLGQSLPNILILRTAWLFGPGRKNFISAILALAAQQSQLTVVHDQIGSPTYTVDLAKVSLQLAKLRPAGLFHAVNGGQASWCELASEAVSLSNSLATVKPIPSSQWPQKAVRPAYSVLDTHKLQDILDQSPRPWPQALREYMFKEF